MTRRTYKASQQPRVERLSLRFADRISKREWRAFGGISNPRLSRVTRGGSWAYFYLHG